MPDTGSRGPRRRKRKNKYFLQDRRLLTEKYYPKEKYFKPRENYYEDSFYDDLEMAYNDPVITVEPRRRKFHKPITVTIPLPQSSVPAHPAIETSLLVSTSYIKDLDISYLL